MDCVFCALLEGRLPADIVYSDAQHVVLLDIYPLRPGMC